ncbi:MAG: ethanolamine utilization protein EutQ [Pseudomonadota bacterium]
MSEIAQPRRIAFDGLAFAPRFEHGDKASVAVATGPKDGSRLGTGFARFDGAAIPWTVRYDEVILVLEGRLVVETAAGTLEAGPRDCIWLPRGTELRYVSEDALVFYAIEPANWAEGHA